MFSTHPSCSDRKFVLDDFYNKITMLVQNVRKSVLIFFTVFPYLLQWGDLSVASLPPYAIRGIFLKQQYEYRYGTRTYCTGRMKVQVCFGVTEKCDNTVIYKTVCAGAEPSAETMYVQYRYKY